MKISILLFMLFSTNILYAAQEAVIRPEKAIVYSDPQLSSPVGFIRRGAEVLVGEKFLRNGEILRIVVSGKIAFIKVKDLYLLDDLPNKDLSGYRKKSRKGKY